MQDYAYFSSPNTECIICTNPGLNTVTVKLSHEAIEDRSTNSAWPRHGTHVAYVRLLLLLSSAALQASQTVYKSIASPEGADLLGVLWSA